MKTRGSKMENGGWLPRSVLDCGSPLPLLKGDAHRVAAQSARGLAHSKTWRRFVVSLVFLAPAIIAHAQNYSIDWFTIDGGGGTSTGGVYSVTGTIGQPDAGPTMSGGNVSVDGGFWSIIAAVQTPGAPLLTITRTTTNTVAVSWPSPSTGFTLQQNTNGLATVNWSNVVTTPSDDGTTKTVIVNPPTGDRFYRLKSP
ncbi:MAG: hypothetical protein HY298_08515 [Verrucomicrobia bacterium]|nr:hypothetical protein [Verrucomicrobiota bacterium]